jgi:hypothetical protein
MLTVGDKFPDLHMKGVNEENEIIDVDVVLARMVSSILSIQKILLSFALQK